MRSMKTGLGLVGVVLMIGCGLATFAGASTPMKKVSDATYAKTLCERDCYTWERKMRCTFPSMMEGTGSRCKIILRTRRCIGLRRKKTFTIWRSQRTGEDSGYWMM